MKTIFPRKLPYLNCETRFPIPGFITIPCLKFWAQKVILNVFTKYCNIVFKPMEFRQRIISDINNFIKRIERNHSKENKKVS